MIEDGLSDCCRRYLDHALACHIDWAREAREILGGRESFIRLASYVRSIEGKVTDSPYLLSDILDGTPCPWHRSVPEEYLKAMDREVQNG